MYNFLLSLAFSLLGAGKGVAYFLPLRLLFFLKRLWLLFFFSQPAPAPMIKKHPVRLAPAPQPSYIG